MHFDDIAKRIGKRNWQIISDNWLEYISRIEFPIPQQNDTNKFDELYVAIWKEISEAEKKSTIRDHYFDTPGVQQAVFTEALMLAYKGINSLKSAQCDQSGGYKSWSIANYYESSYFFCKSVLLLLGIGFFRTSTNKDLLIDLFPDYSEDKKKKSKIVESRPSKAHAINQPEHYEVWTIFKRILNITGEISLDKALLKKLQNIDPKVFAKQRNKLICHNGSWLFDDLKKEIIDLNFGIDGISMEELEELEAFSVIIAFRMAALSREMFKVMAEKSERFKLEFSLINKAFEHDNNKIFKNL